MNKTRGLLFTAAVSLAMAFTLSCEEKSADKPSAAVADTGGTAAAVPKTAEPATNATLVINETCVVGIMLIEDDAPEDETGDGAHYTYQAQEKLEKLNLKTVWVTNKEYRYVSFMLDNGENFIVDTKKPVSNGGDFLYKKGKKPMEFSIFGLGFGDDESSWKKIGAYLGMTWKDMKAMFVSFTDSRDGKKYKTVRIGSQTWMAENLNFDAKGSKCYANKPANCQKYGRLYDWKTAKTACPSGWHLPSNAEWQKLVDFAGGDKAAGAKLKAKSGWNENDGGANLYGFSASTDEFGFSALPGGSYGEGPEEDFCGVGSSSDWWSATESDTGPVFREMLNYGSGVGMAGGGPLLCSVRCLQD